MNQTKPAVVKKPQERFRNIHAGRNLYTAFLVPTMLTMVSTRAFAADIVLWIRENLPKPFKLDTSVMTVWRMIPITDTSLGSTAMKRFG